jgi:Na+/melibiose symporter-like transporter
MKLSAIMDRLSTGHTDYDGYEGSRRLFLIDGVCAGVVTTLVGGVILAGLMKQLGIPDWLNGIIGAIPSFAAMAQIVGAVMAQNMKSRKSFVATGALVHRLIFGLAFFCTMFGKGSPIGIIIAIGLMIVAHLWGSVINAPAATWLYSIVYKPTAGRYYALRTQLTQVLTAVVGLGAGYVLDIFTDNTGFYLVGGVIMALAVVNFTALKRTEEPPLPVSHVKISYLSAVRELFTNKKFRRVAVMGMLYSFIIFMVGPYYRVFIVSEMNMSYSYVNLISFLAFIEHILVLRFWGRMGDSKSWGSVCAWAFMTVSIGTAFICFMNRGNAPVMHVFYELISNIGYSVTGMALLNWQLLDAPKDKQTMYIGTTNAINGIVGFAGVFAGTALMKLADSMKLSLFGLRIVGVHLMALVAVIIFFMCAIYILRIKEKVEIV